VGGIGARNLEAVKAIWNAYERQGEKAGMEALIAASADDVEFRPYGAGGETLDGADALRDHVRRTAEEGGRVDAGVYDFLPDGDLVVVRGWVRITRPGGGLADAQVQWTYTFRDGKIASAVYEPASVAA
jgi:ketosteroid isomerase-like protein